MALHMGAQLYTIRDFMQTPQDMARSLRKIAAIGYRYVQLSGAGPYDPAWMRGQLDDNGLACVLTHIPADRLTGDAEAVARAHDILGTRYIGLGYWDVAREGMDAFADRFLPVAQTFRRMGKTLMYHNHDLEFERLDGDLILNHIAARFPAELLGITLDTFWVQAGGGDPVQWLYKLKGRTPCIHLKDMSYGQGGRLMQPVGEGNMNMEAIVQAARDTDVAYALVEQDACNGEDPFDCLARSYRWLRARGLE